MTIFIAGVWQIDEYNLESRNRLVLLCVTRTPEHALERYKQFMRSGQIPTAWPYRIKRVS